MYCTDEKIFFQAWVGTEPWQSIKTEILHVCKWVRGEMILSWLQNHKSLVYVLIFGILLPKVGALQSPPQSMGRFNQLFSVFLIIGAPLHLVDYFSLDLLPKLCGPTLKGVRIVGQELRSGSRPSPLPYSPKGITFAPSSLSTCIHKTHWNVHFMVLIHEDISYSGDLNPECSTAFERSI